MSRQERGKRKPSQRRKPHGHHGSECTNVTTSKGALGANRSWERLGTHSCLEILEGTQTCQLLDFRHLVSRTESECMPSVLSRPGCSDLRSSGRNLVYTMADNDSLTSLLQTPSLACCLLCSQQTFLVLFLPQVFAFPSLPSSRTALQCSLPPF